MGWAGGGVGSCAPAGRSAASNSPAVVTKTMPLGNTTGMTQAERDLLGNWIRQGAKIK